jgi:NAD(P)-dependent dehydrogenase (short-subunit alcohol dehydrogenase family)
VRALVTGAAGAIGSAAVELLAAAGHRVIAQDLDPSALERRSDLAAERLAGDLRDQGHVEEIARVAGAEPLGAVVAAHGVPGAGSLASMSRERLRLILEVNAGTIPALLAATLEPLRARGGTFVAVASQAALRGEPDNAVYCASKWGVRAWVQAVAPHLRGEGVFVRVLCPGRTEGPLLERALEGFAAEAGATLPEYVAGILALIPLGRYATTAETAAAAIYLADPSPARPTVLATSGGEVPW